MVRLCSTTFGIAAVSLELYDCFTTDASDLIVIVAVTRDARIHFAYYHFVTTLVC